MKRTLIINPLFPEIFTTEANQLSLDYNFVLFESLPQQKLKSKFFHKILNILKRVILKDKSHYRALASRQREINLLKSFEKYQDQKFDSIFIMRGDRFPESFIRKVRSLSSEFINYQCDGMVACPDLVNVKDYFDKIFTFESEDIKNYPDFKLLPVTNFYFERLKNTVTETKDFFLYYLGVGIPERLKMLEKLAIQFPNCDNRFLVSSPEDTFSLPFIRLSAHLSYSENIQNVLKSRIIVDLKLPYHNGLSFRFFESLGYEKKMITNNFDVKKYDFYHPHNIFLTNFETIDGLEDFLEKPYFKIDNEIRKKYTFENWLKYIFNIKPNTAILLP